MSREAVKSVLIARERSQAESLAARLEENNKRVICVPVIEIIPSRSPVWSGGPSDEPAIGRVGEYFDHIVVVSGHAARQFISRSEIPDLLPQTLAGKLIAIGKGSATPFEQIGCSVQRPVGASRSEALLDMPEMQTVAGSRILLLCGEGGRRVLEEGLRDRGAEVSRMELYRREFRKAAIDELRCIETKPDALIALSGFVVECLYRALVASGHESWSGLPLVVPNQRVTEIAKAAGFSAPLTADGVSDEKLFASVQKII